MPMIWQPIESAPKDGTEILLFVPGASSAIKSGRWVDQETLAYGKSVRHLRRWSYDDGWFCDQPPSHWLPLPDAPKVPDGLPDLTFRDAVVDASD